VGEGVGVGVGEGVGVRSRASVCKKKVALSALSSGCECCRSE